MRTSKSVRRASFAAAALLVVAAPVYAADSLSDSVEQFLDRTQKTIEENKLWKFTIKPSLRESVIWTDNVYLNDKDEKDLRLTRFTDSSGNVTTNRSALERIERTLPEFDHAASQGREGDWIFQSELGADLVLPVNEQYFKAFQKDHITVLGVKVRNQEYADHNELDNDSVFLHTDVFGFLSDLLNQQWGEGLWVRVKDDYSHLRDPLDTSIRLLRHEGITTVRNFNDFGRSENTANIDFGYNGAQFDASAGYENYHLWLDDEDLTQAQHHVDNFHAVVGSVVPGWDPQRVYARYDYSRYGFARAPLHDDRGNVVGHAQILNDADVNKGTLGVTGPMISDKTRFTFESAYENWKPHHNGLSGDDSSFSGVVNHVQAVYKPWEERNTSFQFEYRKTVGYSAISNFSTENLASITVLHEAIPRRLDLDFTVAFSTTNPSDGPFRKLLETGVGATYHLYKQVDLSLRYLFRHQTAHHEIETNSAFARGGDLIEYQVRSDSAFYQNIVELSVLLHF